MTLRLDEANKLAQELSDRKKELKEAMFDNKLASFSAFPCICDASLLGELVFTHNQLPFKKLDIKASNELKSVEIPADYDFLLPLDNGQRYVIFRQKGDSYAKSTQMSCFDRHGRLKGSHILYDHIKQGKVAQYGPSAFVVHYFPYSDSNMAELIVFDTALTSLRSARCRTFSSICSNSKFVFGLFTAKFTVEGGSRGQVASATIEVHHLEKHLSRTIGMFCVAEKYAVEQIMADEHHLVAMCRLGSEESPDQLSVSIFDLASCSVDKKACFFWTQRHVEFDMQSSRGMTAFLHCEWLVVPHKKELVWFDKNGNRSERSTDVDLENVRDIYSSGSRLFFVLRDKKLLMKQ